jgi:antirestriction protein
MNLQEAKIYVGTRAKYNNGSLDGKWVDLSDFNYLEDFLCECAEIHDDEEDPEFMFQDWENIPEQLVSESSLSEDFFYLRDEILDLDKDKEEAFWVWLDNRQNTDFGDPHKLVADFNDSYVGKYYSEEEFAESLLDDYDLSEFARTYFDVEKFANDLFTSDFWYEDGFVFDSN